VSPPGGPDAPDRPALGLAGEIAGEAGGRWRSNAAGRRRPLRVSLPLVRGGRPIGPVGPAAATEPCWWSRTTQHPQHLARVLTGAGLEARPARSRCARRRPRCRSLLLTDVVLPDGSGMDVAADGESKHPESGHPGVGYPDTVLAATACRAGVARLPAVTTVELLDAVRAVIDAPG
jgi:hypothetical protein